MIASSANVFRAAVVSLLVVAAHGFDHSHAALDHVLKAHVRDAAVDYAALKAAPGPLDAYLDRLAAVPEAEFNGWTESERLAFLINLYNAATLKLIAENYPVKSIKSIGWVPGSAWKQEGVRLFGKKISLDEVEHGIIRKKYKEARVHFALVCAARGCPPLRAEAFVAGRLDAQLQDQGVIFLGDGGKNRADVATRTLYLSEIFKWFAGDFEAASGSVQKFVAPFFPEPVRAALAAGDFKIAHTEYDWSLNDQAKK
jgi:hypothetical protein